ncbi:PREDICTED: uncharacterized protein LOC105568915 [Vollenhovia emeryi]|uniref:uncharacterized protein LOC105568915 n=1 Tax=Vollenhovia emeryi TaxID=411798 RepID=UPI0005F3D5F0|nr:PREDICTED: uncharacterized protein LOC105568915 [Vollenhovia emeryi]
MLREETDERVDYRAAKADGRVINNHRKGLNYLHLVRKYSDNENRVQKRKEISCEATEDEAEDEEQGIDEDRSEEEDTKVQKVDTNQENEVEANVNEQETAQIGQCAICHINIDDANLGGRVADSEGYLLCQRCVRNFSFRADMDPQPRRSHASFFQGRGNDRGDRVRTRTGNPRRDQWACNFNRAAPIEMTNELVDYESDAVSYVADRDRGNPRRVEQAESRGRQCLQQHSYCNLMTTTGNSASDRYASEIKVKSSSADCSRRPIHCPLLDCSVNVAFSALTNHFLFDHPEVPLLCVEPGAERTLIISYGALPCNSSRCLALLLVSGKLSDSSTRLFGSNLNINPKYRNRLPLPVLAARLHSSRNYACSEEVHAGGEGQCEKDMIIAWVAGLDVGDTADKLRCSIQAVDSIENGGFRSLTYTGPVTSLRVAQCPRDVFLAGDCIVLHEGLISHITSGCTSLNVNVIVH